MTSISAGPPPAPHGAGGAPVTPASTPRKAYRSTDDALLGGVAAGLAYHLGAPVLWVRVGFVVAAAMSGFGVLTYAGLWMVLPSQRHFEDSAPGLAAAARQGLRPPLVRRLADAGPLVALGAVALGVLALVAMLTGRGLVLAPLLLAAVGVAVLWRQADEAQRERWRDSSTRIDPFRAVLGGGWGSYARVAAGIALLVVAITLVSLGSGNWSAALSVGLAALLGIVGVGFILGPWLFRLSADLSEERAERVRSQERADVAAHLHDSVLQTLALIQRSAGDEAVVARLARAQERDLRGWLYAGSGEDPAAFAAALNRLAGEVEDTHGVAVEVVCVGDRPVDDTVRPLLAAIREAVVNAAGHSGAPRVDVYAEIGEGTEVFVRDRGFDLDQVPGDRHGVRDSIIDRMHRHQGVASIRSRPGEGTEVRLLLPGNPGARR